MDNKDLEENLAIGIIAGLIILVGMVIYDVMVWYK